MFQTGATSRVGFTGDEELFEALRFAEGVQPLQRVEQGFWAQLQRPVAMGVIARSQHAQFPVHVGNPQPLTERPNQIRAALLVAVVAGPLLGRRDSLAEIVNQYGEAGHRIRVQPHRLRQRQQGVDAGINLRMMRGGLRHPEQLVQFRCV